MMPGEFLQQFHSKTSTVQ